MIVINKYYVDLLKKKQQHIIVIFGIHIESFESIIYIQMIAYRTIFTYLLHIICFIHLILYIYIYTYI